MWSTSWNDSVQLRFSWVSLKHFFLQNAPWSHYNTISFHYSDATASRIISLTIVYSAVYSGADQRRHQSSASLAFVRGIHRWPMNSPHKWLVTWKMFPLKTSSRWTNYSRRPIDFHRELTTPGVNFEFTIRVISSFTVYIYIYVRYRWLSARLQYFHY